jgi:hypothetical protein
MRAYHSGLSSETNRAFIAKDDLLRRGVDGAPCIDFGKPPSLRTGVDLP